MAEELGSRLVRSGLVSRDELARAVAAATRRGTTVCEALVDAGLEERSLIELFLSDGFGPLVDEAALGGRDPELGTLLTPALARALLALPLRRGAAGLVVAMANPTDEHAIAELRYVVGEPVVPAVARLSTLRQAIRQTYAEADAAMLGTRRSVPRSPAPPPNLRPPMSASSARSARPVLVAGASAPRGSSNPPPRGTDSWDDLAPAVAMPRAPESPRPPEGPRVRASVAPRAAPRVPGDVGVLLASMRAATTRDEVVLLACEAALSVARSAVFLGYAQGMLKGILGVGPHLTEASVRSLWVPLQSASAFQRAVREGAPHSGPLGTAAADQLFRAAVASRGGAVAIHGVFIGSKPVGVLAADEVGYGTLGEERIAAVAHATGGALRRLIALRTRE